MTAALGIIELRSLNDNGVGGEIDTPGQGSCTEEHAQDSIGKEVFREFSSSFEGLRGEYLSLRRKPAW